MNNTLISKKQSLKEKVQLVIQESLEAEVLFKGETIVVRRQLSIDIDSKEIFAEEYGELLKDLSQLYSGSKKVVLTIFSIEAPDMEVSMSRFVSDLMRESITDFDIVIHSYTCDATTGIRSSLTTNVLAGLSEETISGLDVDIRAQKK